MAARIEKIDLPGIGTRHDLVTESGSRIGVVSQRSGERQLAIFDGTDPDAALGTVDLTEAEAVGLADILGASVMLGQLAAISTQVAGLFTEQLPLPMTSPFAGGVLGDTQARTRTKTSIVAIIRGSDIIPSPTPDTALKGGDTIIAVGTRAGLEELARLLDRGAE
ncbi:cation:proton antiporter regulatory subunit [uncultured Schumannella sp.]|uniref:cation:proton antiporter regulatory subunit n=1 Tax=uncultured Schumannella sp. TaxID=1195956 RepID=UPI0025E109E9|nr:TrkA C-terminal domain-containing protein [uncultured Schumannella sp.]